ncbi:MAG: hypothetical protein JW807_02860 [Spirochaetes bacterium]|nr:hypothetical protein [Spirochaetota bacterium]
MHDRTIAVLQGFCVILCLAMLPAAPVYNQETRGSLVFNPGYSSGERNMHGWLKSFTLAHMREWAKSRGLAVADDRGPVVDNSAAYVGPYGSTIILEGLARGSRYRMWIDFVWFRSLKKAPPAVLKIFASSRRGPSRLLTSVRFEDIGDSYYVLDIPVEITIGGSAEIRFVELTREPGIWGVWDIIVSYGRELPQAIHEKSDDVVDPDAAVRIVQ